MPLFTPWAQSTELAAAKKIVDDTAQRITTVKSDIARMKQKLSTFKKETLARLVKETGAKLAVAEKLNKEMASKQPEVAYMRKVEAEAKTLLKDLEKMHAARLAAIKQESDEETSAANAFRANGDGQGGGSQGISARLCEQYEALLKALETELATATKEKTPSANRKV
ncbi:MAG: hypothetical protein JWP52_1849 [Rhizobacter sp.]|nr:hypothetical protein [Rhizobacter sp.]